MAQQQEQKKVVITVSALQLLLEAAEKAHSGATLELIQNYVQNSLTEFKEPELKQDTETKKSE